MRAVAFLAALLLAAPAAKAQHAWPASYPEGPVWIEGALYWAEMTADKVMAWKGAEPAEVFRRDGCGPTAIARYRAQDLIVLCHLEGALAHLDAEGKLLGMIRVSTGGHRLRDPNDASADGKGGVWFSDPGVFSKSAPAQGAIYYLAADGTLTRHMTGLAYGNGVFVDRAGRRLLVSEHLARRVLSYPLVETGLGEAEVLFDLDSFDLAKPRYPETGPDGLEIDADGVLWVAEYGVGRLLGWHPERGLVAALTVDAQFVTNVAFGADGQAAMTGAKDNRVRPYPGAVWVFDAKVLSDAVRE